MIFSIIDMDKMHRNFIVADNNGNNMKVTGYQIVSVLANGSSCTNAKLTRDGFLLNANGTLIEIKPQLDNNLRKIVNKIVQTDKEIRKAQIVEQAVNNAQPKAKCSVKVKPTAIVRKSESSSNNSKSKTPIVGTRSEKIYYNGNLYYSEAELCKKFGCEDINRFRELYARGYSIPVCLGLEQIDKNAPAPQPRYKQVDKMFKDNTSSWYSSEIIEK